MALHLGTPNGTVLTKAVFQGTTATPAANTQSYTVGQDVYEDTTLSGAGNVLNRASRLKYSAGQVISAAQYNNIYVSSSAMAVSSISPTALPIAGGTTVTIKGTNVYDASSVTFGGVAGTALTVVNDTTITVVSPATTAGVKDVVLVGPGGNVTQTGAVTYA